ncbi:MAG: hypothetical protein Q7S66_03170 [bacterium]|nr:hypothetical protein [bacterium]
MKNSLSGSKSADASGVVVDTAPTDQSAQPVNKTDLIQSGPQVKIVASDQTTTDIINKVFKHVFLQSGDVQVQTINKPDELRKTNPVFYQYAKAGDYILLYSDRAILYDPIADLVLDIEHIADN